jgi:RNA polymerase sigma-70 factor (ECF subfamily)
MEEYNLVVAAARRDARAFAELYGRYSRNTYNLILRSVRSKEAAEDLAQEVWIKVYRELPRLRDPRAFPAWLYRTTSQACVDAARKRGRSPQLAELSTELPDRDRGPESIAMGGHDAQLTREALAALPAQQHLALFLREVDDRSYREISGVLGISETAVGLCLMRARRSFAKAYQRLDKASQRERCEEMQSTLARVHDGEATPLQRKAAGGHLASCEHCRLDAQLMRDGSKRYAMLALAPVPAALNAKVLASVGLGAAGAFAGAASAAGSAFGKIKLALVAFMAGAGVTAGAAVTPATRPVVLDAAATVRAAPVVSWFAGGSSSPTTGSQQAVPSHSRGAGANIDASAPAPVVTPVPAQAPVVTPPGSAGPVSQIVNSAATAVAPLGVQLPIIEVPAVPDVIPTVAALPSDVLPDLPLPELPILPTVTVGGVDLP